MIEISLSEERAFILPIFEQFEPYVNECFLIGAASRDVLFAEYRGIAPPAATADIDFALGVSSWEAFDDVKQHLINSHGYKQHAFSHRLITETGRAVDLVPYGDIEAADGTITLPEESLKELTVLGFDAVSHATLDAVINGSCRVRIASPASMILLKLIAWSDRPRHREKDILDVMYILKHFGSFLEKNAWIDFPDIMDEDPFDWMVASARMIGREVAILARTDERCVRRLQSVFEALSVDRYTSPASRLGVHVFLESDAAFRAFLSCKEEFGASL